MNDNNKVLLVPTVLFEDMYLGLERSSAVYELLHAHARGETDMSEEQLANVVTGVNIETRALLVRAGSGVTPVRALAGWREDACRWPLTRG